MARPEKKEKPKLQGVPREPRTDTETNDLSMRLPVPVDEKTLESRQRKLAKLEKDIAEAVASYNSAAGQKKMRAKKIEMKIEKAADRGGALGGIEIASLRGELANIEADAEQLKRHHLADVTSLRAERDRLVLVVQSGKEYQPVDCVEIKDFAAKTIIVRRLDVDAIIEQRDMEGDDLQQALPTGS